MLACSDDRRDTEPGSPGTIADQLRANADTFAYTIGRPGGTLTVATVSDPLTLNLAIATDSASVGVLEYLFEGLTGLCTKGRSCTRSPNSAQKVSR